MKRRKVCIFTGSRAECGLLKPLMEEIKKDDVLQLQTIVSGMHLSKDFGSTYKELEEDGFTIDEKVNISLYSDTPIGISKSIGLGVSGISRALQRLQPDIVVILGDRFEAFAAAIAAMISRIPLAHVHGGEATYGLIDEAIRHSITKMSHLHFTSLEAYRKRIIQLGEEPKRVFNVGALGLDNIKKFRSLSKSELEEKLRFKFNKHNFLVTFHPVTLERNASKQQFKNLIKVLDGLKDTNIIFTKANADTDGRIINRMVDGFVQKHPNTSIAFTSMGQINYLSTMRFVDAVIGNSSSGIIEAPSFKIGTINIGDRQKGRFKPKSIIDSKPTQQSIRNAISTLYSSNFKKNLKKVINPYGDGKASERIKDIIKKFDLNTILKKTFFELKDIPEY